MRWLLFLSRLAFICGMFFLVCMSPLLKWTNNEAISRTIIILGYAMGLVLVPVTNLCYLAVVLMRKKPSRYVPKWLVISNVLFLFILIACIFYFNDPYYN